MNPAFLLLSLCLFWQSKAAKTARPAPTPNIIFLLTDDQRHDALGVMGNPYIRTPNIDQMARQGILFKNAYVTTSICSVSRASILSGQYLSRHGIDDFARDFSPQALQNTYPLLLKKRGYTIGFVGKYGVGENPPEKEFDFWACNRKGQPPYEYRRPDGSLIHHTDSVAIGIHQFLNRFGKGAPFCLSVSFKAPHELDGNPPTYPVQERFKSLYNDLTIPQPETADPTYWNRFPDFFRTDQNIGRERWKPLLSTNTLYQQTVKDYYRLVTGVDEVVGKLRRQLDSLGVADNTVIIYMGDNGFCLGEHGLEGKWFGFEESIRVPLIVYDPRNSALKGRIENKIALNIDIAPTILQLAGSKVPDQMQGIDLNGMALSKDGAFDRQEFFYEHTFMGSPRLPKVEGIVRVDSKYMKYIEHGYEELYDLKADPHEKQNLASSPAYQAKLEAMRKRYADLKKQVK
ncbi:sulfatase family protein [Larkinella arboricola]